MSSTPPLSPVEHAALAMRIASRAVISEIETQSMPLELDGVRLYDVRPMLDPREHSALLVDLAAESLSYAFEAGLITSQPNAPHLVRICHAVAHHHV